MTLLNTINVGGTDYGITGAAVLGSCATPAGSEIKVCTFSDNFELKAGDMLLVKFTYANTYGDGSATYPKLQVNGTNYVMRRADGNYLQSGEWGNNATLTFLFDGTDFILPAGSGSAKGSGVPLGTILAIHSNQVPDGYLPCNGVQFDTAQFAALYALLGDDHTPDLREVTLRGIGHNGTYVFDNTETDPSTGQAGTQNHDEYTLGEFKDDQLQTHSHYLQGGTGGTGNQEILSPSTIAINAQIAFAINNAVAPTVVGAGVRVGSVTRGKSVGVNYIIKATSGLPDDQQDYILNTINGQRSYSTTEHPTGKKWIDGKPIYSRTFMCTTSHYFGTANQWVDCSNIFSDIDSAFVSNIDTLVNSVVYLNRVTPFYFLITSISGTALVVNAQTTGWTIDATLGGFITLEYTKTTPST